MSIDMMSVVLSIKLQLYISAFLLSCRTSKLNICCYRQFIQCSIYVLSVNSRYSGSVPCEQKLFPQVCKNILMRIDVIVNIGLADNRQISSLGFLSKNGRRMNVTVVRRNTIKLESKPKWRDS